MLNEEEAVGTVAGNPSVARQTPVRAEPVVSREQLEPHGFRRKGRARALERTVEEAEQPAEEGEGMDVDEEEEELRLGTLGLEDEDEEMSS